MVFESKRLGIVCFGFLGLKMGAGVLSVNCNECLGERLARLVAEVFGCSVKEWASERVARRVTKGAMRLVSVVFP